MKKLFLASLVSFACVWGAEINVMGLTKIVDLSDGGQARFTSIVDTDEQMYRMYMHDLNLKKRLNILVCETRFNPKSPRDFESIFEEIIEKLIADSIVENLWGEYKTTYNNSKVLCRWGR